MIENRKRKLFAYFKYIIIANVWIGSVVKEWEACSAGTYVYDINL